VASETSERRRRAGYVILALVGLAVAAGAVALYFHLSRPPQMGAGREVFETVDALYTAVRSRDEKRLEECARRLEGCRRAGKLPADAADHLDRIIRKARSGSWQTAAERLHDFMLAQRREGAAVQSGRRPVQ
jgi:hypothetical protein